MKDFEFKLFENKNIIIYGNLHNDNTKVEFKPDCPKKIKKMWQKLNEPIRSEYVSTM